MEKFILQGFADDLLYDDGQFKTIKLVDDSNSDNSNIVLEMSSFNEDCEHKLLDNFLGKKIEIQISVIS